MNAYQAKKTAGLILASGLLSGCAGLFDAETDAASPIAPRVQALVVANRQYSRWADFPQAASTTPSPIEVAARVRGLATEASDLTEEAARIEWTLGDPATLASEITARVDAQQISPATAQTQAEVESFAADARRRAVAPPPIDRTPPNSAPGPR